VRQSYSKPKVGRFLRHGVVWDGLPPSDGQTTSDVNIRPTLSQTGNEYRPKWGDALRLRTKGRYWLFPLVSGR